MAEKGLLNPGLLGINEFRAPVPWGHISGKAWGDPETGKKVLAVHGWMDNAGSYDKLIPLLPRSLYIVAIELPGHGKSSHLPTGIIYHYTDFLLTIRRVIKFLKWEKFSYIGHSMGASLGFFLSEAYPNEVDRLVSLDMIKPVTDSPSECLDRFSDGCSAFQPLDKVQKQENESPKGYCYEDCYKRLMIYTKHCNYPLSESSAKAMTIRGTRQISENEWAYTRDQRLMCAGIVRYTHDDYLNLSTSIRSHLLILKAAEESGQNLPAINKIVLGNYEKNCASFAFKTVPGNHFFHLNEPGRVADDIGKFLLGS